jgi:hypothetical protein
MMREWRGVAKEKRRATGGIQRRIKCSSLYGYMYGKEVFSY